jgi:hypothetical protein
MTKKVEKTHDWKKEIARDFFALGSWIFYLLVIARALIEPYRPFVDQLVIAGFVLVILRYAIHSDGYFARGFVLTIFTSLFYEDLLFTIFAFLALIGLFFSSGAVGRPLIKRIRGLVIGILAVLVGYYVPGIYS